MNSRGSRKPGETELSRLGVPAIAGEPPADFISFTQRETQTMPAPVEEFTTVIPAGSEWNGTLTTDENARIAGHVSGQVTAKGTVHIVEGARVDAKVRARFIVVSGNVKGEIHCDERLELMPEGRVEGVIVTKMLKVHDGAVIDVSIKMSAP